MFAKGLFEETCVETYEAYNTFTLRLGVGANQQVSYGSSSHSFLSCYMQTLERSSVQIYSLLELTLKKSGISGGNCVEQPQHTCPVQAWIRQT